MLPFRQKVKVNMKKTSYDAEKQIWTGNIALYSDLPIFEQPFVQEGQRPLTGQRAANFRLLANQWAERWLVTQWRHGCRAMRRSVCNAA